MNTPTLPTIIAPEAKPNAVQVNVHQPVLGQYQQSTNWHDRFGEFIYHSQFSISASQNAGTLLHTIDTRQGLMPSSTTASGGRVMIWESPYIEAAQRIAYDYEFLLKVIKATDSRVHLRTGYGYNNSSIHATAATQNYSTIFSKDNQDMYLHKGEDVIMHTVHPYIMNTVQNKVNPSPSSRPPTDTLYHPWNRIYFFLEEDLVLTGLQPSTIDVLVYARPIIHQLDSIHYDPTKLSTAIHGI